MTKNLIPEALHTSWGDATKLIGWAGIAVIIAALSRWSLSHHVEWTAVLRVCVALAPLVPSVLWARSLTRWMRHLDELQRRIQYEAWLFATVGTLFVITALSLLKSAEVFEFGRIQNGLGWEGAFALLFALYCVGCITAVRRYK